MDIQLPPIIVVRQYLRAQRACKKAYRDWFEGRHKELWSFRKLSGQLRKEIVIEYNKQLTAAGALNVSSLGSSELMAFNTTRSYNLEGYVLWSIGLGSNQQTISDAYSEEMLMLVRTGVSFSLNKVVAHEAPMWLGLTRHCLERMVERGALPANIDIGVGAAMNELFANLGLALAHGIAKETDEDQWSRTAFVPLGDGLVIFTNRILVGPTKAEDFGWKSNFTKRKYSDTYIKRELSGPPGSVSNGGVDVSLWVGTTYISADMLSREQSEFLETLLAWIDIQSDDHIKLATDVQFNPDFTYRPERLEDSGGESELKTIESLRDRVAGDAFKSQPRLPLAYLLEPDMDSRAYRSAIRKLRS